MSSYDPLPQPWRRRSRDDSRRSWRASRRQPRRRQPRRHRLRRRRPRRRLTGPRQRPHRRRWRWPPRRQPSPRQRHQRHQRHQRFRRLRRSRRRSRVRAYPGPQAKPRLQLGPTKCPPPHHGHVQDPPEDSPALLLRGVPVPRGPATTRSPPRREWVGRVRRVPARTALDLGKRVRLLAALHWHRAVAQEFRECHDPTRR